MKKAHIVFMVAPNYPHIGPTLPIASVLVRRGYRVSYLTSERFAPRVTALGGEVVTCSEPKIDQAGDIEEQLARSVNETLREATVFNARDNRPDLIVYDAGVLPARILLKNIGVPAVLTSPFFANEEKHFRSQANHPGLYEHAIRMSRHADNVLERFGVSVGAAWLFHKEKLSIFLVPKALQPCAEVVSDDCLFAGRCAGEQLYYGSWSPPQSGGRPTALVATSTNYVQGPSFFKMCIEALSNLGWHVILSIGDGGDPSALGTLPPHFEIIQRVSHVKILPHVDVFICLGGNITASEAAYQGVPMILTTHGFPELEWQADNLVRVGIGVHLRKDELNARLLRDVASDVNNDARMRARTNEIKHAVRREPGAEDAANWIEEYLEDSYK